MCTDTHTLDFLMCYIPMHACTHLCSSVGFVLVFGCLSVSPSPDLHLSEVETATAKTDPPVELLGSLSTSQIHGNGYNCRKRTEHCSNKSDLCYPLFSTAKLRCDTIAAVPTLWDIPDGPKFDLLLSGASTNYMSLSWVDLQWTLWLVLLFPIACGKT